MTPARTALLAAGHGMHRGPGTPRSLFCRYAALLVSFFHVLGLAFLFVGLGGFVTSWHHFVLLQSMLCQTATASRPSYAVGASQCPHGVRVEGRLVRAFLLCSRSMGEQKECQGMWSPPPATGADALRR